MAKTYPFNALLGRMKYITRWSLMHNSRPESLSEHTADTALIAHMLCRIALHCTGTGAGIRPDTVATAALYHDAPEILTGTAQYLTGGVLNDAERKLLKAADRLSALIKCIEEGQSGNREFEAARAQQEAALHAMDCPEAEYFMEHMLPCYTQNLDELTRGRF